MSRTKHEARQAIYWALVVVVVLDVIYGWATEPRNSAIALVVTAVIVAAILAIRWARRR